MSCPYVITDMQRNDVGKRMKLKAVRFEPYCT